MMREVIKSEARGRHIRDAVRIDGKHYLVSTVDLSLPARQAALLIDSAFGRPVAFFETMVFPADEDGEVTDWLELYCRRYQSWEDAGTGHAETVANWVPGMVA